MGAPAVNRRHARSLQRLNPALKAYLLGYLSSTAPKTIGVLLNLLNGRLHVQEAVKQIIQILRRALAVHRFPAFCGVLIGGSTIFDSLLQAGLSVAAKHFQDGDTLLKAAVVKCASRFIATLITSAISFSMLNSIPKSQDRHGYEATVNADGKPDSIAIDGSQSSSALFETFPLSTNGPSQDAQTLPQSAFAGKTMDLTLFAFLRASDVLLQIFWTRSRNHGRVARALSRGAVPSLFSLSVATIMFAWFYSPQRLPHSYVRWISAAAELDPRLLLALRQARYGNFVYGKDTGLAPLLGSLCKDYGLPEGLGDPAKTIPVPCELVHMGSGKSCERHALSRALRGSFFAAKMYLPLHLLILARDRRRLQSFKTAIPTLVASALSVARSSAFLGAFISLFYYGVCLSRTRLGPKIFDRKFVSPQAWDSGLCVMSGCALCGWSILVEEPKRRAEILFFVMPRAMGTWFPRRYLRQSLWIEQLAFAFSTAIVLTAVQERPQLVRGVLGRLLRQVLT